LIFIQGIKITFVLSPWQACFGCRIRGHFKICMYLSCYFYILYQERWFWWFCFI